MARFFMAGTNLDGGRAYIRGRDAEHVRVLRLRPGEELVICDGKGTDYRCRYITSTNDEVEAEVVEVVPCRGEPAVDVTVYAGLPKGERADFLIQKCVEAGAKRIVFFNCERCVAKIDIRIKARALQPDFTVRRRAERKRHYPAVEYIHDYVEMLNSAAKSDAWLFMYEAGTTACPCARPSRPRAISKPQAWSPARREASPWLRRASPGARVRRSAPWGSAFSAARRRPSWRVTAIMYARGEL